jgi:hypothetical protein
MDEIKLHNISICDTYYEAFSTIDQQVISAILNRMVQEFQFTSRFQGVASLQKIIDRDSHKDYQDGNGRFHRPLKVRKYQDG